MRKFLLFLLILNKYDRYNILIYDNNELLNIFPSINQFKRNFKIILLIFMHIITI